jgi:hypothetical protein
MHQNRIHFNSDHPLGPFEQRFRERAAPRADLDRRTRTLSASRVRDAIQNRFAGKEMLPEAATQRLPSHVDAA